MPLLLNIDTATEYAGICLSDNGICIGKEEQLDQKNHASFLQPAIQQILKKTGKKLNELDAIAVTGGPGSYTGIRVGMSSAKGLCFSTTINPTINNNHTSDGTGSGSFSSTLTGLTLNTTYYVRAYATNISGTSYGNQVSFTTVAAIGQNYQGGLFW